MVLEILGELFTPLLQMNSFLIAGLLFVFVLLAYKLFKALMKAAVFGVIAAMFPLVAAPLGLGVPLSLQSMLWFGVLGIGAYFVYSTLSFILRVLGLVFRGGKTREKVIIREVEKKKGK